MTVDLTTPAEKKAQHAESLPAFTGLNLLHIKRQVAYLLHQIGGQGIFDEYTKHDISHIDAMLHLLTDWLIPPHTQDLMSPADWLITVLGVYFHDLGMLVTKHEYNRRDASGFIQFRDTVLFSSDDRGKDYRTKVYALDAEDRDRFLYQEFVRAHHARRVRYWIIGTANSELGIATETTHALDDLLRPLGRSFRQDLALVCESHHLDDLDDIGKYKLSQPYGNSPAETANLQYAAVLLRTADLLHITCDRTPSIVFRVLNPADPISQREWVKQMAVRRVRSQIARDNEGNADASLARNTIEVHASFTDEDGFFGLTSYLEYAERQLKQSHAWVAVSQKRLRQIMNSRGSTSMRVILKPKVFCDNNLNSVSIRRGSSTCLRGTLFTMIPVLLYEN